MPIWFRAAIFIATFPAAIAGWLPWVRNPMYVGVLTAVLGWALWFWSGRVGLYFAFMALAFHARVLLYEEPVLARSFGAEFVRYRASVPRWIPRRLPPGVRR